MKANYLFYFCEGTGSVFESQVAALINEISEKNIFKKIFLFVGIRNKNQKNDFLARKVTPEAEIVFFRSYPNYPFFNCINRKRIQNVLNDLNVNFGRVMFQTRGEMIAWHLSHVLKDDYHKNIIPDIRGAIVEEIAEYTDINIILKSLKIINNKKAVKYLNKFQIISVVSDSLKEYLKTIFKIDPSKVVITPCLAGAEFRYDESRRKTIRKEFNLEPDDTLIVFSSGGTANWQNNDSLIILAEKGLKVLNLSKKEIKHENVINKFVSYAEMPMYLNAADAAIIWREKSIVNKVASPVKFSEYICCGLPVIANYSVDMISEFIAKYNCGLVIQSLDDLDIGILNKLKLKDRKQISESGFKNFNIQIITNKYLETYSSMNQK